MIDPPMAVDDVELPALVDEGRCAGEQAAWLALEPAAI